jgi:pimeloyl-ACP methyl ester carboxylesterase
MVIQGIFRGVSRLNLCAEIDYIQALSSAPPQAAGRRVHSAVRCGDGHDAKAQLGRIQAPTQITFGRHDVLTMRFADPLKNGIRNSELCIFEDCSHAPLYENVPAFNQKTLEFLSKHAG